MQKIENVPSVLIMAVLRVNLNFLKFDGDFYIKWNQIFICIIRAYPKYRSKCDMVFNFPATSL